MGRKRPGAKTKTVLKPVNKMKQLVGRPRQKKLKNLNKNPPTILAFGGPWKIKTIYNFPMVLHIYVYRYEQ